MTTWGVEVEVATNGTELAAEMSQHDASRGAPLTGCNELHRYHCTCAVCALDNGYIFRFQRDSSCAGEAITYVYDTAIIDRGWDAFVSDMGDFQRHALEVDAEPGLDAGVHIHVHPGRIQATRRSQTFAAFFLWEPAFMALASGRFEEQRGANRSVARMMLDRIAHNLADRTGILVQANTLTRSAMSAGYEYIPILRYVRDNAEQAFQWHAHNDRHTNLNLTTSHGTWEHRWPNSTRSAWRLEMFARTAVALYDPAVYPVLLAHADGDGNPVDLSVLPAVERVELLAPIVGQADPRAEELIRRQIDYMRAIQDAPPPAFTMVA